MQHMRFTRIPVAFVFVAALASCSSDSSNSDTTVAPTDSTVIDETSTTADTAPAPTSTWEIVPSATMPPETQDVPYSDNAELLDGQYWGSVTLLRGGDELRAVAKFVKLYSGEKCYEYAEMTNQAAEDMCTNDYGVVEIPIAIVDILDNTFVSVITEYGSESWPTESYVISAADLHQLVSSINVAGAPASYDYVGYPYLFTIQDGVLSRAEQVWVP